ncbi:arginase family protein [Shimia sp. CNT1-13L.2]|uniref:arginase family protein n=1 Tax=Shimia sp. CNT1-13L.2 TaxID=2959663 RepID=UPI0020CFCEF2|nr:arginase family protein [Shimia sp. CNT1-13L.2]MCP9480392.1 arginase family protein [Shimia sp. CNT1-13L.2]
MKTTWIVTPYFFENKDMALVNAVPKGENFVLNDPSGIADRSAESLSRGHRPIADIVAKAATKGEVPFSIAGDCCASLPVMAGLQKAGLAPVLVWLDAHGDFNTYETSPSGFLGGMPLAMMVGKGDLSIARASGQRPVTESDVWLVEARDLDPLEAEAVRSSNLNRLDLSMFADIVLDRPVHLHIDNDVVDAVDVPANNYPVDDGPRLEEVIEACRTFAAQNRICAVSLSGWNGHLDCDGQTAAACRQLLAAIAEV